MMSGLLATLLVLVASQLVCADDQAVGSLVQESPAAQAPSFIIPEGYTAFPDIGVAMRYYANDLTWNLARKHCVAEGANLAVIDSTKKSEYANALRNSSPRGPFLGIHKLYDGVEWISIKTDAPVEFIPWKSELDRSASAPSCTALYGDPGGRVGPFDCNTSWSHICEVPLLEGFEIGAAPAAGIPTNTA